MVSRRVLPLAGALATTVLVGALVTYKATTSLAALAKAEAAGTLAPKAEWIATADLSPLMKPIAMTINYFSWVMIALSFGLVIGAAAKALVPDRWLFGTLGRPGLRGQVLAALAGAPLMLCSCCIAPVFEGVYEQTRKLGPSLGLLMASPALNPAALVMTFMLFPRHLAIGRLVLGLVLVLVAAAGLGRAFGDHESTECPISEDAPSFLGLGRRFVRALREVTSRSLPAIVLGVIVSAVLVGFVPLTALTALPGGSLVVVIAIGAIAVFIALPTFGEIPIGLALLKAGAPEAAVLALLLAGPAVNLPSLLTIGKVVSARAAIATGVCVFVTSLAGGAVVSLLG